MDKKAHLKTVAECFKDHGHALTLRHRHVLVNYYGLEGRETMTQVAMAEELGVSAVRVRQIRIAAETRIGALELEYPPYDLALCRKLREKRALQLQRVEKAERALDKRKTELAVIEKKLAKYETHPSLKPN